MRYADRVHETVAVGMYFAITSLIVGYSAKGDMSEARRLFDSSPEKNFVMWTAIISGYVKLQQCEDAFVLFLQSMQMPSPCCSQGLSSVEIFCRITNHSTKLFLGILNGPKSSEDQVISGPGGAKHSISISSRHRATRGFPPNAILPVADGRK
ncbi:UNVERIFIED_CONTAM: hypothetical protein Sradi_7223400 [Sesamum radiatum]|uniref:Pentatricopeptide repeat-containing protein n=1 Tax=Sesamum radiatum TaxID=300843 RepID=A0AAW2INN5_SESRA